VCSLGVDTAGSRHKQCVLPGLSAKQVRATALQSQQPANARTSCGLRVMIDPGGEMLFVGLQTGRLMMANEKLILDFVYDHEKKHPNKVWLTQPIGGGEVKSYTWAEAMGEARRMASHLKFLELDPGSHIGIVSKNCAHFFISELAIWMAGHVTVALFPTVSADSASFILKHADVKLLFVGKLDEWDLIKPGVPENLPKIAFPLAPPNDYDQWAELISNYEISVDTPARQADDLGIIIYTSGSTGTPKGVMHNFGGMSSAARGIVEHLNIKPNERCLSYLPLAHVFERAYIECASFVGASHVFFAESLDTFVQDLQRARPTVFISVPRLWLKFQLGVFKKLPAKKLQRLLKIPIISTLIRKKIVKGLGLDCVRLAGSGSAPIPAELIDWYRSLGLNLLEGYAMSEDFAYSHLSTEQFNEAGYVGVPYPEVKVRLSDEGEILIDSPGKMVGYYKEEQMTRESFTDDGYFKTGDRGSIKDSGLLKITGRVKEIFKTSKGKYVAPAPIENIINSDQYVELSCVSGSGQSQPFAQVVIAEAYRDRLSDGDVRAELEAALAKLKAHVNKQVEHHEQLQFIAVSTEDWTVQNGFLTPTLKIRRNAIEQASDPKMNQWYEAEQDVFWA
jgi:long-chain acyl-CoA synthetase